MRKAALVLTVGIALAPLLAACGDDKGDKKSSAPTKAEWTEEANKICTDAQAKVDALGPLPAGDAAKIPDWAKNGIAIRAEQMSKLKATDKPTDLKAAIDATLAKADTLLATAQTTLANAKDGVPLTALAELQNQQALIQKELAAHGPASCGPAGSAPAPSASASS
jgi:hypothetical protein